MIDQEALERLFFQKEFKNIKEAQASILKARALKSGFTFTTSFCGIATNIMVGFTSLFPLSLPQYYILEYDSYKFIPHVEETGKVCYIQDDYLFIDADRSIDIIEETFDKAKKTIEAGLRNENLHDFTTEFEAYWHRRKKNELAAFNGIISNEVCEIKIGYNGVNRLVVSNQTDYLQSPNRFFNLDNGGFTFQNGIYIPLIADNIIIPPPYNDAISQEYVQKLISEHVDANNVEKINKLLSKPVKAEEYLIFSIFQKNGVASLFGVKFTGMNRIAHPLFSKDFNGKITPINIQRLDEGYLYQRGSNGVKQNKKGLLVGAGSIGGFIADDLVRSGFFNLTIVDADKISTENCYRHLVGFNEVGKNKAKAIKLHLENKFPHCHIEAKEDSIESLIAKKKISLADYEFIIVATGNVTINVFLNRAIYELRLDIPIIFSWNDPYGIGGHSLVTNALQQGCYECLYTNDSRTNVASFTDSVQDKPFLKNISGCGSFFTPYGASDSMQTALMTVRKLIDVLSKTHSHNVIYSWKGKPDIFLDEGFKISPRYYMNEKELEAKKHDFISPNCKSCKQKDN